MNIYVMESGKIETDYPYLFAERDEMIRKAEEIAVSLKYTKKFSGNDFYNQYLNGELVKQYRELMRKIWDFSPSDKVVEIHEKCEVEGCTEYKELYDVDWTLTSGYVCHYVHCAEHAQNRIDAFGDHVKIVGIHKSRF